MKRFLLFVIIVCLAVFAVSRWNRQRLAPEPFTPAAAPVLDLKNMQVLSALNQEYTNLVQAVVPSVVSVTTSRKVEVPRMIDPFELFFGRRQNYQRTQNFLGSGVIVSQEGHILTNNHVVENMDDVEVQLNDGRKFPAKIIGADPATDIAVLKIDATGIKPLPLGNSDDVKVGSVVFAIGNPFGLQESVTQGIISATRRRLSDGGDNEFFQTEAVINPGNSGGPLVDLRGEIIGINSTIGNYAGTGTWQGVGFAIPSNVAQRSLQAIIKTGRVVHGYLGVELVEQPGNSGNIGAPVYAVLQGSPAEKGGIKSGDVITSFNGDPVQNPRDLLRRIVNVPVNSTVELKVLRDNKEQTLSVTILEQPADLGASTIPAQPQTPAPPLGSLPADNPLVGITVMEISPDKRENFPANVSGVLVSKIDSDAPAANNLQPGEVIEEVNRHPVGNLQDFWRIASSLKEGKPAVLSICQGRRRSFVVIPAR